MRRFSFVILSLACRAAFATDVGDVRDYTSSEWWVVYLTAALCLATFGLMIYTARLWHATVKLSADAECTAAQQRADTIRALNTAERAALASERSAEIAEQSLSTSQRAFVFWKGFNSGLNLYYDKVKEYVIYAVAENVGTTPALNVRFSIKIEVVNGHRGQPPKFEHHGNTGPATVLGPKASVQSSFVPVPIADLVACWERRADIFVWSYLEYQDIFDSSKLHHHQQCAQLGFIHDPRTVPPERHPSYLQFGLVGDQNSAG